MEQRFERLERKYTRLRGWFAAVTCTALVACTAAALAPDEPTVRAERFEVIGKDGKVAAVFGSMGSGTGISIGNSPEDDIPLVFLGVAPVEGGSGGRRPAAACLHMEADTQTFSVVVAKGHGICQLTDDRRSVATSIEADAARFRIADAARGEADGTSEEGEGTPRYEVRVEGEQTSIRGSSPSGEELFRQP